MAAGLLAAAAAAVVVLGEGVGATAAMGALEDDAGTTAAGLVAGVLALEGVKKLAGLAAGAVDVLIVVLETGLMNVGAGSVEPTLVKEVSRSAVLLMLEGAVGAG